MNGENYSRLVGIDGIKDTILTHLYSTLMYLFGQSHLVYYLLCGYQMFYNSNIHAIQKNELNMRNLKNIFYISTLITMWFVLGSICVFVYHLYISHYSQVVFEISRDIHKSEEMVNLYFIVSTIILIIPTLMSTVVLTIDILNKLEY